MGREVRKVPAGWAHPKYEDGCFRPLLAGNYRAALDEWKMEHKHWIAGWKTAYGSDPVGLEDDDGKWTAREGDSLTRMTFEEWHGSCPAEEHYMPEWPAEECKLLMMYETCSEGTPISPAMETPEELAMWLVDNQASAFGDQTASYEGWLRTIKRGWAVSAVVTIGHGIKSGVEAL